MDSHCHLPLIERELDAVLDAADEQGVTHMLCVAVDLATFPGVIELARRYSQIFASVGVHPDSELRANEPDVATLVALADDPRIVAIGETGLDYYREPERAGVQQARFRVHIRAARETGKPLIIHTRSAAEDTLRLMREEGAFGPAGVMHCFTETWAVAEAAMEMGFYISMSGIVTFRNAADLREVARRVPEDRLLVETDSPYLAPVPHRGRTNEPSFVRHVAEEVAKVRGVSLEALAATTTANFFRLFRDAVPVAGGVTAAAA